MQKDYGVKKKPSKPNRNATYAAITVGSIIIGLVIALSYYTEQAKISGQRFGNNLEQIQSDLKDEVSDYESKFASWQKGGLTKQQMLEISDSHLKQLKNILSRYETLVPPQAFAPSLELFKRSTETQLESDKLQREWIETGDNATKIRSDELLQQSFEYETSALASFNMAKGGKKP